MTKEAREEVERMLHSNERQGAIDYLKTSFQVSDAEATLLVETLEKEMNTHPGATSPASSTADNDRLKAEVAELLKARRQTDALKRVQQQKGASLREALVYIGEVARESNVVGTINTGGCLRAVAKSVAVFMLIISLMLMAGAAIIYFNQESSIGNSDRVDAVVTEMKALESGESAPIVGFEWNGKRRSYESTFYSSLLPISKANMCLFLSIATIRKKL